MFVPIVPYHAGGDAAAFAGHPKEYEFALATYLGAGTAACYRGATLYGETYDYYSEPSFYYGSSYAYEPAYVVPRRSGWGWGWGGSSWGGGRHHRGGRGSRSYCNTSTHSRGAAATPREAPGGGRRREPQLHE